MSRDARSGAGRPALSTRPPKGTRDFYPEDMRWRSWLFAHFREVARRFGFEEVDAPIVEHAELYRRKAGEEIVEQLYHFEMHGRDLALRGEITPSIARMVIARQGSLRFPLRWFSIPQCWRYERVQRGRRREHYQWNMDIFGDPGIGAEAELIAAVFALFDAVGLGRADVVVRVSSRKLLEELLFKIVPDKAREVFEPLCIRIDKLEKIGAEAVLEQLADPAGPVGLARSEARRLVDFLEFRALDALARDLGGDSPAIRELRTLFAALDDYGVADRVVFDPSIVRGLAYYTGIVFEGVDAAGTYRSLCGGGRYDHLVESLGGRPLAAVGFGFGDAVIAELLDEKKVPGDLPRALDAVVVAIPGDPVANAPRSREERAAVRLATRLRARGEAVELVPAGTRLKRAMSEADRAGAARIYLLGSDELERGAVKVRDLRTGEERHEPLPE
ncbi:MAG: histidine--tRNA ligase [Deltaproteobacteria bacterium]|nr:MAG: histidine--tRNA ligase [Deltaproteobacteria bacterium]